ncbi:vacuolar protein sorting-associated protein 36 [Aristolochia californica]|uniref:vacuolar protein sorting-associated protein 36 n=1 Tax=Aristolochia californica TaxID=171875 RepID=UPI0035DDCE66
MAGRLLQPAELTGSGRPVFLPGEVECALQSSVDLECEENPSFPTIKSSLLILTTHRLVFVDESRSSVGYAIPLAAIVHLFPPKKSIKSMFASPRMRVQVSVSPDGQIVDKGSRSIVVTIVLRGKNDSDAFYGRLWDVLRSRSWENSAPVASTRSELKEADVARLSGGVRMAGVSGILRKEQETWESTDKSLQDAFHDLNALMSKAQEMVQLAEKMRQKLLLAPSAHSGAANDEEMGSKQEMQDWLLSVGIASPVTKESAGALYHQQLSRQLADFVKIPLERSGGMIALIDVYCLFNRARGTELISPEDLLQACSIWEKFDVPVTLRKFDSGVMVIQSKAHSDEEVFGRIKTLVLRSAALRTGISASDAAITLGIAPALAKEQLLSAESKGLLCRDVSADGFRFYINLFEEIHPSDIYQVNDDGQYSSWFSAISTMG